MLEVGRITKSHGVRGEVVVFLVTDRTDRLTPGSVFVTDRGELTLVGSKVFGDRFIVRFAGVDDRNAADALRGVALRAEPLADDPDAFWVHELIGALVVEVDGTERGVVESVEANPAADLLVLSSGALVPMTFVQSFDDGRVIVDPPAGLFDL